MTELLETPNEELIRDEICNLIKTIPIAKLAKLRLVNSERLGFLFFRKYVRTVRVEGSMAWVYSGNSLETYQSNINIQPLAVPQYLIPQHILHYIIQNPEYVLEEINNRYIKLMNSSNLKSNDKGVLDTENNEEM